MEKNKNNQKSPLTNNARQTNQGLSGREVGRRFLEVLKAGGTDSQSAKDE